MAELINPKKFAKEAQKLSKDEIIAKSFEALTHVAQHLPLIAKDLAFVEDTIMNQQKNLAFFESQYLKKIVNNQKGLEEQLSIVMSRLTQIEESIKD